MSISKKSLNDFSPETKAIFIFAHNCWKCGNVKATDGHHIMGRGTKWSKAESSPLNLARLCRECHELGDINSPENRQKFIDKTMNYLIFVDYSPTDKDFEFMEKYQQYYNGRSFNN